MTLSPIESYCSWLESLPPTILDELALALLQLFPGGSLEATLVTPRPSDGLVGRLRRLGTTPRKDAGAALALAALTDFVFLERADPAKWEQNQAMLELLDAAQDVLGEGGLGEQGQAFIEENMARHPLRQRQWQKVHQGWVALRQGPLDPSKISAALALAALGRRD